MLLDGLFLILSIFIIIPKTLGTWERGKRELGGGGGECKLGEVKIY